MTHSGVFDDPAVLNAHDAAGMLRDIFGVGDQNDRPPFGVQLLEQRQDFVAALGVEGAGGFVGENHRRVVDQGTSDGDALLLAAGKFGRSMIGAIAETEPLQEARWHELFVSVSASPA